MNDLMIVRKGRSPHAKRKMPVAADPSFWLSSLAFSMWGYKVDAVDKAGLRDREKVEKMGTGVPLRKSPGPIVLCLSASQTGPQHASSPSGFLDTVPGEGGGPPDPCNWSHPFP